MPDLPIGRKEADMPIVSGKILVTSSEGEQLSVAYFGWFLPLPFEYPQLAWDRTLRN